MLKFNIYDEKFSSRHLLKRKESIYIRFKRINRELQKILLSEVRYSSLLKKYPEEAEELFKKAEEDAKERLENYKRLNAQGI
jgi:hypothetical protein